jgi:hypothetical protein
MRTRIWMLFIGIATYFEYDNLKEYLGQKPVIGFTFASGVSIAGWLMAINPVLQFLGLCVGLFIGYLTAEAKLEERLERRRAKRRAK